MTLSIEITPRGSRGARVPVPVLRFFGRIAVRMYRVLGRPLPGPGNVLLTTVGARSGHRRTVPLTGFAESDGRWLIVGSLAGSARHPAWFINLANDPDRVWLQVGRARFKVQPELLRGEERTAAWRRIVSEAQGYAAYERSTDREIPIVRLSRMA